MGRIPIISTSSFASAANVQNAAYTYAADAQASDAYAITLTPAPSAYSAGQIFTFKANTANTGASSLNVNSLGAKTIKKNTDQDTATGDIEAGSIVSVVYDGTNFQMISVDSNITQDEIADGSTNRSYTNTEKSKLAGIATGAIANVVEDTTPQLGGALDTNSKAINESKGANIASAGTTNIGGATDGNFIDITGTTTITAFDTVAAGIRRIIRFNGALTLTHNATSLILPGGANITTASGDVAVMVSLGSGNWVCTGYMKASGQAIVASGGATANGTFSVSVGTSMTNLFSLTGLDGDTDGAWELLVVGSSASATQSKLKMMFNSSDAMTWERLTFAGGADATGSGAICYLAGTGGGNVSLDHFMIRMFIKATKTKGTRRSFEGLTEHGNGNYNGKRIHGFWDDTTNNITSLQIAALQDSGSSTYVGHYYLRKVA